MDLSIVIVNWNTRALLADCLASVFENAPDCSFEVIVIDNASKDGSKTMVRARYPQVRLFEMRSNLGFARANNVGFGAARGRFILMLNSDTLVHEGCLQKSVDYIARHPRLAAMGCRVLNKDGTHQHSAGSFPHLSYLWAQTFGLSKTRALNERAARCRQSQQVETLSGCYLLMRARALRVVGPLDEDFFFFGEETDWCRRARSAGFDLHYAPVGRVTHLGGGSSAPLRYRRDLMLTSATVRLHQKHENWFKAVMVYGQLFLFNSSRAVFWSVWNSIAPAPYRAARANHFAAVVRRYSTAWPEARRTDTLPGINPKPTIAPHRTEKGGLS